MKCSNCRWWYKEMCVNACSDHVAKCMSNDQTCDKWETLDEMEALRVMVSELKRAQMDILGSGETNQDYMTGYISALSVVEGMIAEVEYDGRNKSAV